MAKVNTAARVTSDKFCEIKLLLNSWGMSPHLISTFKDKEIDVDIFSELTESNIKEILQDFTLGTQLKFLKKYTEWKNNTDVECNKNTFKEACASDKNLHNEGKYETIETFEPFNSSAEFTKCNYVSDNSDNDDLESTDSEEINNAPQEVITKKRQHQVDADDPIAAKKRMVNPNALAEKRISALNMSNEIINLDLKKLLGECLEGKAILQTYETKKCLEEEDRTALVDIIIKWLLFRISQPKKAEFTVLKEKIINLFTNEENVYYIAPKEEGNKQYLARGKLFDRTRNLKEWMRKKNLLPRVQAAKKNLPDTQKVAEIERTNEINMAINWLQSMYEPWDKVEEKWAITSKYRRDVLIASRSQESKERTEYVKAATYLDEYKVLRLSRGYTLIDIDFATSCQPGLEDALIINWRLFSKKIDSILTSNPELIKDPEGKLLLQLYLKTTDKETKDILLMQCLPSLLPPSRQVQLGKKKFKPTIKESRDAFIAHVKIPGQVANFIANRREEICKKFGRFASVQPYILYVGKELDMIDEILVVIDDFSYKLETFQKALDVCFKSFFVLDMVFTVQCDHIWLLIQKALYSFTTEDDISILKVTSFLKKLELMDTVDLVF